jgi:hypothetical protein
MHMVMVQNFFATEDVTILDSPRMYGPLAF